jgi:oligopeptide/dipeptide ABC transporter ATP-binding protein
LQRLAIVRALIPSPKFIVADEAVSALDVSVQAQILNLLDDMKRKLDLTLLFVSHDLSVVEYICDRVVVMYLGAVVESARAEELFRNPMHPYTRALIAARPKSDPDEQKTLAPPEGEIPSAVDLPQGCRFHTRCPERIDGVCDAVCPPGIDIGHGHMVGCHICDI